MIKVNNRGVLLFFHLFQNESTTKKNVPEFEIARYKHSSKHVQQKLLNAIYSNPTLFHLLPVKYGRKKYRKST